MSNLPVIPVVPQDTSPSLKKFLSSLKELIETREGQRGIHLEQFVTFADLASYEPLGAIPDGTFVEPGDLPELDGDVPDPPTNLVVAKGNWYNHLTWTVPVSDIVSHTEIWCSTVQDRSFATRIAIVTYPQAEYDHRIPIVTDNHYYWIRSISFAGLYSTWEPSPSTGGELVEGDESVGETIDKTLDILLGTTPDLYNAGTTYSEGDFVRYVCSDGTTRRYRYVNGTPASGQTPEDNTTYWERVGILVQGDVDGTATVGIDGNLVVDDTILARNIAADQINGTHIHAESEITLQDSGKLTIGNSGDIIIGNGGTITIGGVITIDGGSSSAAITVASGGDIVINNGGGLAVNYGGDITFASRTYAQGNPGFLNFNTGTDGTIQLGGYSDYNALTLSIAAATAASPKGKLFVGRSADLGYKPLTTIALTGATTVLSTPANGTAAQTYVQLTGGTLALGSTNVAGGQSTLEVDINTPYVTFTSNAIVIPATTNNGYLGNNSYYWKEVRGTDIYSTTLHTTDLISTAGDLRPSSANTGSVGTSGYPWGTAHLRNLYYHTITQYDTMDDLDVISSLVNKVEPDPHSASGRRPDLTQYPDFLTNKDVIIKQVKEENGDLVTDQEIEDAIKDKKNLGSWLMLNAVNHSALLEGAIRQQYQLYKQLESRVAKLEGGSIANNTRS